MQMGIPKCGPILKNLEFLAFQFLIEYENAKADMSFLCLKFILLPRDTLIQNFKTTWSEFQMPCHFTAAKAKPNYVYSIVKPHVQS